MVIRVLIILQADKGKTIAETVENLGCCEQTVINQRQRFLQRRSEGAVAALEDLPRSGRPPRYGAQEQAEVVSAVCETLHEHDLPLSRLSRTDLHHQVIVKTGLADLSQGTLNRLLANHALKPWQYRY